MTQIFFPFQKLIAITIVFHKSYQYAIMSEMTLNISSHRSCWNRLIRYSISWIFIINMHTQIILFPLQKLIAITIVFHRSYHCAIMSEMTLNITLHGSNCSKIFNCIKIAYYKHQCRIADMNCNDNCISQIIPMCHYVRNHVKHNIT